MRRAEALRILSEQKADLARRFGVKDLFLFGSVAHDRAGPESDIDVLVEFDGAATFDRFMGLKLCLEALLATRVDLVTRAALRERLRPSIERDAIHVA